MASDGTPTALDLNQKAVRQRAEHAVEAAERAAGSTLFGYGTGDLADSTVVYR